MRRIVLPFLLLSGCAVSDPITFDNPVPMATLAPMTAPDGSKTFRFVIQGDHPVYTMEGVDAEALRLDMLGQALARQQFCQSGYEITNRAPAHGSILYEGKCK